MIHTSEHGIQPEANDDEDSAAGYHNILQKMDIAVEAADLPVLSNLLCLCFGGARAAWTWKRFMARGQTDLQVPPLSSRWC